MDGDGVKDSISQLPEPILHHILYFLYLKDAARTCVLSKAWRRLWCTRPKIQFLEERHFKGRSRETFLSVLDKTLQGYHDQKLSVQQFEVQMSVSDSQSLSLLEKWIPRVLLSMGVEKFHLSSGEKSHPGLFFPLPLSLLFEAQSLRDLFLRKCNLDSQNNANALPGNVMFTNLRHLTLEYAIIQEETFHKIISSCPLIEYLKLFNCTGLRTIKINEKQPRGSLKFFDFSHYGYGEDTGSSIEIHLPSSTLETVFIYGNVHWFDDTTHKFPNLKSLELEMVPLSSKLFDNFSCNFPVLEELTLKSCDGLEEFQLSSDSIKHFRMEVSSDEGQKPFKAAAIIAPNILSFNFLGESPPSISFTTTSREWKSNIQLQFTADLDNHSLSTWILKLYELLKALSQSEISLDIFSLDILENNRQIEDPPLILLDNAAGGGGGGGGFSKPLVVEHLSLGGGSSSFTASLLNGLFRTFRPRNIGVYYWFINPCSERRRKQNELVEFLYSMLLLCRNNQEVTQYLGQQDLEEVSIEALDENREEWRPVHGATLSECAFPNNESLQDIRFTLKWKEDSFMS